MRQSLSNKSHSQYLVEGVALTKSFGRVHALTRLDLQIAQGQIHGFLGPNGSGKSTTIRAILGQLRLDDGQLEAFGLDPIRDLVEIHRRLAYVPGDTVLWPSLTGGECIDLLGRTQGRQDLRRREELIERFELDPSRRSRGYSKGNRQKVALIAALSTRAELLLLDEPTSGLDPVMAERFIETLREVRAEGATVLLSSHIMSEVEALCDAVTIIRSGQGVFSGTMHELRQRARVGIEAVTAEGSPISRRVKAEEVNAAVAELVAGEVSGLIVRPASLDEIFLEYYEVAK